MFQSAHVASLHGLLSWGRSSNAQLGFRSGPKILVLTPAEGPRLGEALWRDALEPVGVAVELRVCDSSR